MVTMKVKDFLAQVAGLDPDTDIYVALSMKSMKEYSLLKVVLNSTEEKKILFLMAERPEDDNNS